MSDLPKMSTWGTQGQKYEICDQAARERNTQLGKETENIRNEVEALKQMSATAEELPSGSAPTASYSNGVFHIGIPQGPQGPAGEAGVTPNITVTAATGEPGTDVQVEQSGTAENPVLKFTIPRGNDGYVGADGAPGANGQGVPTGGTAGQILRKTGSGDYEAEWSDKAGDSERLGGLDAQYYMQGRAAHNLLDNSNFADLVAQAGLNEAHGTIAYIADRWKSGAATATQQNGYTTLSTTEKTGRIAQKLPDALAGKTVTAAAKVTGNSIVYCGIYYNQNSVSKSISISVSAPNGIMMKSGTIPSDATDIEFRIYIAYTDVGGSCNVYWASLYEGAYTADTLPAYVPKGYAAELAECQRYYVYINSGAWMTGFYKIGEGLCVEIPTAGNIRINNPTVVLDDPRAYTGTGWNNLTIRSVSVNGHATKIVFDFVDSSAAQASYGDALIVFGIDSISADL